MRNVVIAVSPDSSLNLLKPYADIIILDNESVPDSLETYKTVYIRSHFSQPSTLPQNFRSEIQGIVQHAKHTNSDVRFVDGLDNVDEIVDFEDKWRQYKTFGKYMPRTELLSQETNVTDFTKPLFKKRLSSRGSGVTWNIKETSNTEDSWIVQESLNIQEELRVYVICGEVYPICTIRRNMTSNTSSEVIDSRKLTQEEIDFSSNIMNMAPDMDFVGLDIAFTSGGDLKLMEVNRSPGFAKFHKLTDINLASVLYESLQRI